MKGRDSVNLTKEQESVVCKAFMLAFAKKLYREGMISVPEFNRLTMKIEKGQYGHTEKKD